MDFDLDETQQAVRDLASEILRRETGNGGATRYDESVWKALADAGLLSLAVPESHGGAGLGPLETALVLGEVGRAAAPVPALSTLAFGVLPIARHGTSAQLGLLDEPTRVFTAALNEPSAPLPRHPRTTLDGDGRLRGTKTGVRDADLAHRILVSASAPDGPAIVLVDPAADGVAVLPAPAAGGTEQVVVLDGAVGERLGGAEVVEDVHACAVAGICALADGALAGALDLTAEHLRTRRQFGKPLAAFQAVAQQAADLYVTARTLHLAALSACWRLATDRAAGEDLDVAAWWLAEQAPAAARTCHHLHGGLGLDITYPMHRYSALLGDLARIAGGAEHRLDLLAARV